MEKIFEKGLQAALLEKVEKLLPPGHTLVDSLEELLGISTDSIYRRLRCETPFSILETATICSHFNVSFDELLSEDQAASALFLFNPISSVSGYKNYLRSIKKELELYRNMPDPHITWAAGDPPVFQHFRLPMLAIFKLFYWFHFVVHTKDFEGQKFNKTMIDEEVIRLCSELYNLYASIPSTEIWTDQTINSLFKQVDYVWQSGLFESKEDALEICSLIHEQIDKIALETELTRKLSYTDQTILEAGTFNLYRSDIEPGSNSIFVKAGEERILYLTHNILDVIVTRNSQICDSTDRWLNKLIRMSTLISGISEKERSIFFRKMKQRLTKLESSIADG